MSHGEKSATEMFVFLSVDNDNDFGKFNRVQNTVYFFLVTLIMIILVSLLYRITVFVAKKTATMLFSQLFKPPRQLLIAINCFFYLCKTTLLFFTGNVNNLAS